MAYGDSYAEVWALEARLNQTDEDGSFGALLDAASRTVEAFTRRQFNRDTGEEPAASPRRFRAVDRCRLPVDDFHTATDLAVEIDGTALDVDTQVDCRPWDGFLYGQPGWPFSDLFRIGGYWPLSRRATVTVTAHWGWATVPEDVRQATLDVASVMYYGLGGATSGPVRAEAIDSYSVSYQSLSMDSSLTGQRIPQELVKAAAYRRKVFGIA